MGADAIQQVIDDLAERLQRSVVIDDPDVRLLWASPHYGDEDEVRTRTLLQRHAGPAAVGHVLAQGVATWTTAGVIPPNPSLGMHARVCVPIRWRGDLLGLLVVVDADGTITTAELARISAIGDEVAALMFGEREPAVGADLLAREAALDDLLDQQLAVRRSAVRALAGTASGPTFEHVRVVELAIRENDEPAMASHVTAALRHAVELRDPLLSGLVRISVVRERSASVLLGSSRPTGQDAVDAYAGRLLAEVDHMAARHFTCVAGVGSEVTGLEQAWSSGRQARLACQAAVGSRPGRVVNWSQLGAQALILRLPLGEIDPETLPDEMQRLRAVDRDGRLTETVRALLDHAGDMPAAAAALHIHRTTLYYRLERVTALAGLDLADGATRLALQLSLAVLDAQSGLRPAPT